MSAGNLTAVQMAERTLVIERVFNAPRHLVFQAWTDPEHIVHWFGPRGFKSTVLKNELRPGGAYRIHMLGPDGDHWSQGVYREIVPPERLLIAGSWADAQGKPTRPENVLTLTFAEQDGKTKLTLNPGIFEMGNATHGAKGGVYS